MIFIVGQAEQVDEKTKLLQQISQVIIGGSCLRFPSI